MKINRLRRHYIPRSFHTVQKTGWTAFVVLVLFVLLGPLIVPGFELSFTVAAGLTFISVLVISLGNVMELQSHNRRIRGIELAAKAITAPLIFLLLIRLISKHNQGYNILLSLIVFLALAICLLNIKWIWDRVFMNRQVVTCAEMKDLERQADEAGLSYLEMMENAGTEAFGYICEEEFDWLDGMLIFCGSGNNGGDGFVIARKAMEYGCPATVILPCGKPKTPDAITNYEHLLSLSENRDPVNSDDPDPVTSDDRNLTFSDDRMIRIIIPDEDTDLAEILDPKDKVIVDCIFGTGFHGEPGGISKKAIEYVNDLKHTNMIYAVDVPSGLPGDDGPGGPEYDGSGIRKRSHGSGSTADRSDPGSLGVRSGPPVFYNAVYSDCTISFHARKPIHLNPERNVSDHLGKVIVADIGITAALDPTLQ